MKQEKAVNGFNLPRDLISELIAFKKLKSINLSDWAEKDISKELEKQTGGMIEDGEAK